MSRRVRRLLAVAAAGIAVAQILTESPAANAADASIDLTASKQVIRGFGASSAWCGTLSTAIMDSLYKDLGYSILRVRIEESIGDVWSSGNYSAWKPELTNAQNAIARGAIVFASPWNPPASMKSAGKLLSSKYADYANYLKAYAKYFADNSAPLYAISIQNEPDYANDWTAWTATDLHDFLKAEGAGISSAVKIMMPESFQFRHPMSDPSLNDATVASYISIIGGHLYGGTIQTYPLATDQGKELWQTEHYFDDDTIANVMKLGKEVHDCMVTASMNAYVYWWITWPNGLADSNGTIFKRAYALGQFAKYIRPGYRRVDATASPTANLNVSAYTGDDKIVIVAVNTGTTAVSQNFVLRGGTVTQLASWQTSASSNMTAGQAYATANGSFAASLPSQSITTFVGSLSGTTGSGGSTSTGGASATGGNAATGGGTAGSNTGGRSSGGGRSGVGGTNVVQSGGRGTMGGGSSIAETTVAQTGGRRTSGGGSGVSGAPVVQTGGRSSASGASGIATGGSVSLGGQTSSSKTAESGRSSVPPSGTLATGGPGSNGSQSTAGGSASRGVDLAPADDSSGCSCRLGRNSARSLGGSCSVLLVMLAMSFRRKRAGEAHSSLSLERAGRLPDDSLGGNTIARTVTASNRVVFNPRRWRLGQRHEEPS